MRDNLPDTAYPHSPGRLSSPTADIDAGFAPGQCGSAVKNIQEVTISAILVAKAYENPRHLAVVSGSEELSYGELNVRVDRLTRRLKALGVGQGATVAVFLPEATDLVVAALAVLKTAAVLVPLDPSDPIGRLAFILQDSGATLVITHEHMRGSLSGAVPLCFLGAHQSTETQAPESSEELLDGPVPADVACLLYHSSPAGRPQGILVRHKALCASGLTGPSDVLALNVRFSHEVTCYEIFRGLAAGASVVHIPNQLAPRRAASVIRERSVTVMWGSVALLTRLAQEFPQALKNLRQFVCDEGCHSMNRVRQIIPAEVAERVCGFYGSTEVGGACALFPMARIDPFQSIIPLRLVTPGTTLYVLDDHLDPVPEGTMGEIYVDGENLAKGYHRDPGRSAQVFVPNRFSPNAGARLCRTGDLAREHVGGNLELCGRRDGRSTVGGSRIEPEEIEAAL